MAFNDDEQIFVHVTGFFYPSGALNIDHFENYWDLKLDYVREKWATN
jgi:hypothetical protein